MDKIQKQPSEVFYKNTSGRLLLKICHKNRKMNKDDIEKLIGVVKERKERTKSKVQNKSWWIEGYNNWDQSKFKKGFRVSRETFEYIFEYLLVARLYDVYVRLPFTKKK